MEIVVNMKVKGNLNNMSFDMSYIVYEFKFLQYVSSMLILYDQYYFVYFLENFFVVFCYRFLIFFFDNDNIIFQLSVY